MTSTIRRALPALLLTTGVLAVAFAGGATAAGLITGEQIKNNSITNLDVKNSSLKGNDVKNGSLGEVDLNGKTKKKLNASPNTIRRLRGQVDHRRGRYRRPGDGLRRLHPRQGRPSAAAAPGRPRSSAP